MTRFLYIAAAGLGLTGCLSKNTNICSATQVEPAITAVGPRTVAVNQTANFLLTYAPVTTCNAFDSFLEQTGGGTNARIVGVRVNYSDCSCPVASNIAQVTYSFKPTQAGTYYLKFMASTTTGYITDTLVVQ